MNREKEQSVMTEINSIKTDCSFSFTNITLMRFLPHAHRISLLSPAPVSHIFHNCRPSMPRKQKAALVPTPIKQSHGLFLQASNIARYHSHCSSRRSSPCNSRSFGIYSRKIVRISTYSLTKRLTTGPAT